MVAGPFPHDSATTDNEVYLMGNISSISTFWEKLGAALAGDFTGWTQIYETTEGLRRYVLPVTDDRVYEAYAYCGRVHVYDPDMRRVCA